MTVSHLGLWWIYTHKPCEKMYLSVCLPVSQYMHGCVSVCMSKRERERGKTSVHTLTCVCVCECVCPSPPSCIHYGSWQTHLLCSVHRPFHPPLCTIDISFYANVAFGYVRTRQYFHRQSFIPACLWPYGPRQSYCCTVHKLLSVCQEPLSHIQTTDTQQGDMRKPWGESRRKCEGARVKVLMYVCSIWSYSFCMYM